MARYQVKAGERFACNGEVHEAGAVVELGRTLASDPAIAGLLQEVDAKGQPMASPPQDDLERFKAHERVSILRDRRAALERQIADIDARIQAEDDTLRLALSTLASATAATPPNQE